MEIKKAEELYYKIRNTYNSPYADSVEEVRECINILFNINEERIPYILAKATILANKNSDFKQKTSTIIKNKFWL